MPNQERSSLSASHPLYGELGKNWGWMLAFGLFFIVLGTIGLGMTFGLTLASVLLFGVLLIIAGLVQLADVFKCRGWKSIIWHVLNALLYVAGGILIITDPILASAALTLMLAAGLMAVGAIRILMSFQHRGQSGWGWMLFSGLIAVVLGLMIMAKWPVSGLWVIGLFLAIELIMSGWSYLFLALAARRAASDPTA
jgi:uncharacterized membrane protein HdeD (DUF308 family)